MAGQAADEAAVDAVATRSLGEAAGETTIAQYRALVVLASRGPQRMALREFAAAAGEIPGSQWPADLAEAPAPASATRRTATAGARV
jgi:hypothetical protein